MRSRSQLAALALLLCAGSVLAQETTLHSPAEINAGAVLEVGWTGPDVEGAYITVVPPDEPGGTGPYALAKDGNPAKLRLWDEPGLYLVQYRSGQNVILAQAGLKALDPKASVTAPPSVKAGDRLSIEWTGPSNPDDFITVQPAAAPGNTPSEFGFYGFAKDGSPTNVQAPTTAGLYEVRYVTGQAFRILARSPLKVE